MDIWDKLKPIERRLAALKKHIEQVDMQALFVAAYSYLKGVMNGKRSGALLSKIHATSPADYCP